ncbi:hypothetical protein ADEAN_000808300 [Angomonas deanei]|uniref:Uncharacterized protein n=1 Tax=Angomonas deanei TaxID=59799 RepID=A0A7G2CNN7_9TRYP|nr:hypothetical protein ADEAN_000808300 [Angomonas deanei]
MWRLRAIPLVTTQSSTLVTAVAFASGGKSVKQVKKKKKKEEKVIPNKRRTVKEEPKLNSSTTPNNSKSGAVHSDMAERDTRLAVRLLMARHFSREYTNHRPEDIKLAEHRQAFREKHEDRLQRLEEKTNNSLKLLGRDGDAFGEGILPVFSSPTAAREKKRADGWRTVNPVSDPTAMDDGEVEEDWGASFNTLESLQETKPLRVRQPTRHSAEQ